MIKRSVRWIAKRSNLCQFFAKIKRSRYVLTSKDQLIYVLRNHISTYQGKRCPKFSPQCKCKVIFIGGLFSERPTAVQCLPRERWQNTENSKIETQIFLNTLGPKPDRISGEAYFRVGFWGCTWHHLVFWYYFKTKNPTPKSRILDRVFGPVGYYRKRTS